MAGKGRPPVNLQAGIHYAVNEDTGCWLWLRSKSGGGYGFVSRRGKIKLAHRVMFEESFGPISLGVELHHRCVEEGYGSPSCVNPGHLQAISHAENVWRGQLAKLTREEVAEIRQLFSTGEYTRKQLRERFNISKPQMSKILNGQHWSGVS